jgi:diguanylate cyclase (GGDEF)-like protein
LPNRRFFKEKLTEVLGKSSSDDRRTAVLMLDLDGFKTINDIHGHAAGDRALIEFAERVSGVIRPDTILARVGGDEFAILMPAIVSLDDSAGLARRILGAIAEPFMIESCASTLGVGIGIAVAPDIGMGGGELTRRADLALCEGGRPIDYPILRSRHGCACGTARSD